MRRPNPGDGDIKDGGRIGSRPKKVAIKDLGERKFSGGGGADKTKTVEALGTCLAAGNLGRTAVLPYPQTLG